MPDMGESSNLKNLISGLKGPIVIFGAGGFIGLNLLKQLLKYRSDVIGVSQDHLNNWRFLANRIPSENVQSADLLQATAIRSMMQELKPRTIFNLAAYGAYSKQKEYDKIYQTNFVATIDLIEIAKELGFDAFIQAGSSSEYGCNSAGPSEDTPLLPNSHYAVSKAALFPAIKYYARHENLPIAQLRLYSVFGPWEEPDRLIPVILSHARKQKYPPLVHPEISRDFIYINDVVEAFIKAATNINTIQGHAFNVGTGIKTTIGELTSLIAEIYSLEKKANFGTMPNRKWDLTDWFANPEKSKKMLQWSSTTSLREGLIKTGKWQKEVNFDQAFWNWNKA
jgi:nucleoside-diphosphate-sugar epimerase